MSAERRPPQLMKARPRMNLLEKAIAVVSPEWALNRAAYREYLRSYEAGEINRFNDDWTPINADTENTDKMQRDLIKARARYLENNSDIAAAAVNGIVRNVVGTGIRPQARTKSEATNREIERLWTIWTRPENCDITGQQSFYELQAMLLRRQVYDGEIFVKKVYERRRRADATLKLQVIKSDMLNSYQLYAPGTGNIIRSGVELDDHLKPLAYWIDKKSADGYVLYDPDRIPAEQVIHLWSRTQPDQIRGMSYLTPIVKRIKDTQDYLDAETMAARIAACFSVFVTTTGNTGIGRLTKKDAEGKPLQRVRPGMITHLAPGESIETANPSRSVTNAKDFVGVQQRLAGAGVGLSYELMSRDFTKSSFSAARQGMLEDQKTFKPLQDYMATHFCQPVYEEFLDAAVLSGQLSIRDYWENRDEYTAVDWIRPGQSWIDPENEVKADISAIQNGGKTLAQWCAERGQDWREQLEQMALEKATAEKLGLILPIHTPESVQAAESNHINDETDKKGEKTNSEDSEESQEADGTAGKD